MILTGLLLTYTIPGLMSAWKSEGLGFPGRVSTKRRGRDEIDEDFHIIKSNIGF